MRSLTKFLLLLSLVTVVSCGKSNSHKGAGNQQEQGPGTAETTTSGISQNETITADGSNVSGIYATDLWPVNTNLQFLKVGAAAVERDGDNFTAHVKLIYGAKDAPYKQAIYTGRRCPTLNDDLNHDLYIDIQEALIALGKITIPLDGNLDSQLGGINDYPVGDAVAGKFNYKVSASFQRLFADLKDQDPNPNDLITKITEGITFPGRVILIQGTNETTFLPTTVASTEGESMFRTLPVACGVLWKVDKLPDELK